MHFSQGPNLTVSVDVWIELQQRASAHQRDITCSSKQEVPKELVELLLSLGGPGHIHRQGFFLKGVLLHHSDEAGVSLGFFLILHSLPWNPGPGRQALAVGSVMGHSGGEIHSCRMLLICCRLSLCSVSCCSEMPGEHLGSGVGPWSLGQLSR